VGKENETPGSSGSRGAKDKAVARLHDLAPDIALYEKEKRRAGGVVYGGRKLREDVCGDITKKRDRASSEEDGMDIDEDDNPSKKAKISRTSKMRLLITGYKGWTENPKKEERERVSLTLVKFL
jgi:hypothetical protein